jgi:hypothetical protein
LALVRLAAPEIRGLSHRLSGGGGVAGQIGQRRLIAAVDGVRRALGQFQPDRKRQPLHRPARRGARHTELPLLQPHHAALDRNLVGLADRAAARIVAQYVPAGTAEVEVGSAFGGLLQVAQQVGATHLDLVHHRLDVSLHRGVADGKHVRHGDAPLWWVLRRRPGHLRAQGQAGPDHAPGTCHLKSDLLHQRFVLRARGTVALQRLGQQPDAGVGHAQGLVPAGRAHTLQQPGGEQLDFHEVLAGPAGRAVDLPQAAGVGLAHHDGEAPTAASAGNFRR